MRESSYYSIRMQVNQMKEKIDLEMMILPQRSGLTIMSTDSLIQTQMALGNQ